MDGDKATRTSPLSPSALEHALAGEHSEKAHKPACVSLKHETSADDVSRRPNNRYKGSLKSRRDKRMQSTHCTSHAANNSEPTYNNDDVACDVESSHNIGNSKDSDVWDMMLSNRFVPGVDWLAARRRPASPPPTTVVKTQLNDKGVDDADKVLDAMSQLTGALRNRLSSLGTSMPSSNIEVQPSLLNDPGNDQREIKWSSLDPGRVPRLRAFTPSCSNVQFEVCLHNGAQGLGIYFVPRETGDEVGEAEKDEDKDKQASDSVTNCTGCIQCSPGIWTRLSAARVSFGMEIGAEVDCEQPFVRR
jgi:hypothetical protein